MSAIYVTSIGEAPGRVDFCGALAKKLQKDGKKVGFLLPVSLDPGKKDKDVEYMKHVLSLDEPLTLMRPVSISVNDFNNSLGDEVPYWLQKVQNAFTSVSDGKDIVVLEGVSDSAAGASIRVDARIASSLDAKIILFEQYTPKLVPDRIISAARSIRDNLIGVVISNVPEGDIEKVKKKLVSVLEENDITVLGILPSGLSLFTMSIDELAEHVGGSILNAIDHSGNLVASLMTGALSPDSGISYLGLKDNKAVITRGDHADIQLAALSTSTACLVLTENIQPLPSILNRAEELEVPIIVVEKDTVSTLEALEVAMGSAGFYNEDKLQKLMKAIEENIDVSKIY